MGDTAQKVGKTVKKAADTTAKVGKAAFVNPTNQIGSGIETAAQQSRNEISRNLGTEGSKVFDTAVNLGVEKPLNTAGSGVKNLSQGKIGQGTEDLVVSTLETTKIGQGVNAYKDFASKNIGNLPPVASDNPDVQGPSAEDVAKAAAADAALQEQIQGTRRRGRASTILTGPQGLNNSNSYSARRTLLGV